MPVAAGRAIKKSDRMANEENTAENVIYTLIRKKNIKFQIRFSLKISNLVNKATHFRSAIQKPPNQLDSRILIESVTHG